MCTVKDLELLQRPNITLLQFQKMFLTDQFEQRRPKTGSNRPVNINKRGRPKKLKIQDGKYVEVGVDQILEEIDPKVFANSNEPELPTTYNVKKRNKKDKEKAVATKYRGPADENKPPEEPLQADKSELPPIPNKAIAVKVLEKIPKNKLAKPIKEPIAKSKKCMPILLKKPENDTNLDER
jgi:hypothetical protein